MKRKHKICFVFAVVFTLSSLLLAVTCVDGLIYVAEMRNTGGMEEGIAILIASFGLTAMGVILFFTSFCGVVASAAAHNCPAQKIRRASRITLGVNGTLMAFSVVSFFCSLL